MAHDTTSPNLRDLKMNGRSTVTSTILQTDEHREPLQGDDVEVEIVYS